MIFNITLFLITGFIILIKGADLLIDGSSSLARKFKVSDLVIGLTVVAFGTSTPELFVNIFSSLQGKTEITIGNILGSNIFNILLILGVSSLIYPLAVSRSTVWKEIPFCLLAAVILGVLANDHLFDGLNYSKITRIDGFVFLAFFIIFMYYLVSIAKDSDNNKPETKEQISLSNSVFKIGIGFLGLMFGGKIVVDGAIDIATIFGVSQSLIGLTIVAAGTSLPELATSAVAAYKKNADIAVGNIVGSNIFNIFFVLGISGIIKPLTVSAQYNTDIMVLIGASLFLFIFMFTGKKHIIDRWEGMVFLLGYILYTIFLIKRG